MQDYLSISNNGTLNGVQFQHFVLSNTREFQLHPSHLRIGFQHAVPLDPPLAELRLPVGQRSNSGS